MKKTKEFILAIKIISTIFLVISILYFLLNFIRYNFVICDIVFTTLISHFTCILVHEFGHIFSCLIMKTKITHVCIFPFSYKFESSLTNYVSFLSNNKKNSALIFLSGIFTSLFLEIFLFILVFLFFNYFHLIMLIVNFFILLGSLFNKNSDLKKARKELK